MNMKEYYSERINYLQKFDYVLEKESPLELEITHEKDGTVFLMIDEELDKRLSKINNIKLIQIRKEIFKGKKKNNYLKYETEYEFRKKLFIVQTFVFEDDWNVSESVYAIKDGKVEEIYSREQIKELSEKDLDTIRTIMLITRKRLTEEKQYRLRNLFNPFEFDENWLIHS